MRLLRRPVVLYGARAMDEELARFKTEADLRQVAAGVGFAVDARESSRRETVMRRGVYYTFSDTKNNGTGYRFPEALSFAQSGPGAARAAALDQASGARPAPAAPCAAWPMDIPAATARSVAGAYSPERQVVRNSPCVARLEMDVYKAADVLAERTGPLLHLR